MTPHEERKLALWNKSLSGEIHLKLHSTEDRRSEDLRAFCRDLGTFAPRVRIAEVSGTDGQMPFIEIGPNLRYSGVPVGLELDPFLHAASLLDGHMAFVPKAVQEKLKKLANPVSLKMYVAQQCPTCPGFVRQLIPLSMTSDLVRLHIIDAGLFEESALTDGIQGVPTVLFGSDFRWTGQTPVEAIVEVLADPADLNPAAIERMLAEGGASKVAKVMLGRGEIFPAFIDFLAEERFTTRLGAMTAMEEITHRNMALAATVADPLWQRFERVTEPVQIDLLYLLGEIGAGETIPRLESIVNGHHRDHVKEVARESIERIRERGAA